MTILIVEDEPLAAERLERLIKNCDPTHTILDKIDSLETCEAWLSKNQADLIFMDIHLSDGNAFKLFEKKLVHTPVIFCTAYDQYAIKAFQHYALDYLLKPVTQDALNQSFKKIDFLRSSLQKDQLNINALIQKLNPTINQYQNRFMVQYGQKIKSIPTPDIAYFYAEQKMTYLKSTDDSQYVLDTTLDRLENKLDPTIFFRINRKFIIHRQAIQEMVTYSKSRIKIVLSPEIDIESIVSIDKSPNFKSWLNC